MDSHETSAPQHSSFTEFYPFYLSEHSNRTCRRLHFVGSTLSLARLEGRIAIGRFLQRFPDYQLTQTPVRGGRARFRGFLHAPFSIR